MSRTTCGAAGELLQSAGGRQALTNLSARLRRRTRKAAASTQISLALLELEAGAVIGLAPHCPRWASNRVDAITVQIDRALGREVVL